MCDCTYGSDPAQPQFWHKCNENEIEKLKNSGISEKKLVYEEKDSLQSK